MRVTELCMLVLSTTVLVFPGHAQGHIHGVSTDSASSKLLVGANFFLLGAAFGSSPDLEGQFSIVRVALGHCLLRVSYIRYEAKAIPVQTRTGQSQRVDGALAVEVLRGRAIVL
ncbi:MAG: carboxypeptidase-like regulatory domain-containing protein [Candidatus Oleimicrobiaceae bacterium]